MPAAFILLTCLGLLGYLQYSFDAPFDRKDTPVVIIDKGSSIQEIADHLESHGVVPSAFLFRLYAYSTFKWKKLKAGEYAFDAKTQSYESVINKIASGQILLHKLSVPEGLTSFEIVQVINNDDRLSGPVISEVVAEGTLLPETYLFPRGEARSKVLARMHKAHENVIQELWPPSEQNQDIYRSPQQMVILASLVEKETSLDQERAHIAGVFLNRLRAPMPLQCDATVLYGLKAKGELSLEQLKIPTPFNTYVNQGLPPTPICNPGKAALKAAFKPLETKDIYFVANGQGGHVFAATLAEHQKNHEEWRKIRKKMKDASNNVIMR